MFEAVLLGIGLVINLVGLIYNIRLMLRSSRANAWQDGFDEGLEQGKIAEQSKQRVWADGQKGADDGN